MALSLNLAVSERNDNKVLTLTDASTGWGTGGDLNFTDIDDINHFLYVQINITSNANSSPIITSVVNIPGPFVTQSDITIDIDASTIGLGTIDTLLPDGIYDITYYISDELDVVEYIKTLSALIIGQSQKAVYNKLRLLPIFYNSKTCKIRDVNEAKLYYAFLRSIEKNAYIAKRTELLEMLETLQRLLLNGSNYPW